MSEYQYYEFQAIDKPLTRNQMSELKNGSTRAEITPHRFVNEYHWGDFNGDADEWMRRYFDAFLYLANWGTHIVKLRLPSNVIARRQLAPYLSRSSFDVDTSKEHLILSFVAQDEDGDDECDTDDVLSALIPIREEIARGDFRALYIGWLLGRRLCVYLAPPVDASDAKHLPLALHIRRTNHDVHGFTEPLPDGLLDVGNSVLLA